MLSLKGNTSLNRLIVFQQYSMKEKEHLWDIYTQRERKNLWHSIGETNAWVAVVITS